MRNAPVDPPRRACGCAPIACTCGAPAPRLAHYEVITDAALTGLIEDARARVTRVKEGLRFLEDELASLLREQRLRQTLTGVTA